MDARDSMGVRVTEARRVGSGPGPDLGLIDRARHADREAFDLLVRSRLDRLYRFAMAVTRSEADARDAVQDACILAWRQLPTLREPDRFDAWLDQIVVNSARMVVRRTNRIRVRELSSDVDADPRDEGRSRVPEPSTPAATDGVADGELIRRAFGRLDGDARTLLVLHHVEGVPVAEIARRSGSPVGTVKWRLSRARAALERALEVERR